MILVGTAVYSQSLLQSTSDGGSLFDKFQEAQFQDKTDKEALQEAFRKKRSMYEALMSRESPILFQADYQELNDETRVFLLTGNVQIWKDMFKIKADWVRISQWSGEIEARGNVVLEFDADVLSGDEAFYNFDTGTGWISNARASIEPHLFVETDLLRKLPDHEKTGMGQYALENGTISACSAKNKAWKFKAKYAVIRLENYAHMNNVSAWIRSVPIFWMPYFFYPTKSDRATGLLVPRLNWSSTRGLIISEEFFLCINDYMDATAGIIYHTVTGVEETFQFRDAFDQLSKGELNFEHIRERQSPSKTRDPEERWRVKYEQNAMFPLDIRGTANLMYQSDELYNEDYGDWNQGITQYLDSRMSLSRYWGTTSLTLDGSYQKNYSETYDERLQYLPRLDFFTGWKNLSDDFRWQLRLKGEHINKSGNVLATVDDENGDPVSEWLRLDETASRYSMYGTIGYDMKALPWLNLYPWVSSEEKHWDSGKTFDPRFPDGTWATYAEAMETPENTWYGSLSDRGDGYLRHVMRTGIDLTGPKLYRIFDLLGYKTLSRVKHIIEPKISLEYTPEILGQERILYFDQDDYVEPGTKLTYSLTTRLLMKLKPKSSRSTGTGKPASGDDGNADREGITHTAPAGKKAVSDTESSSMADELPPDGSAAETGMESPDMINSGSAKPEEKTTTTETEGIIREFGYLTVRQTYDFYKESHWDEREVEPGQDERIYYPLSNISLDLTINPVANLYLSGRVEYDPWHDEFSTGYLYGHVREKKWEFGLRWDFSRNFLDDFYDMHAIALEGGRVINDSWEFASWVKYDFSKDYFPYIYLDITYSAQCWGVTLHTYYKNNREFDLFSGTYENDPEIKFGLSFHLKNIDTIDTDTFGRFWWSDSREM